MSEREAILLSLFVLAILAVCVGVGGSLFYTAKGKMDVALEMAKHGASPAAIGCIINPPDCDPMVCGRSLQCGFRPMTGPLILTVTPRGKPGIFIGKIEGTGLTVRASRHPLVDTARALLLVGCDPKTVLILRNSGSSVDRVRGSLSVIVRKVAKKHPMSAIRPFPNEEPGERGARGRPYSGNSGEDVPR